MATTFESASPDASLDAGHDRGTNAAGNDTYAQAVHGLQRSLVIAITVSLLTTVISAVVGCTAAYFGGRVEQVVLGIVHFLLVVPSFLILALVTSIVEIVLVLAALGDGHALLHIAPVFALVALWIWWRQSWCARYCEIASCEALDGQRIDDSLASTSFSRM